MRQKNITPYISIIFVNRNDLYTHDQVDRINAFIDFYSFCDKKYPNLFEFIICDWNPPQGITSLEEGYDWSKLSHVKHLTVSPEIHAKLCPDNSRPILDYTGKNVCIRQASAPFILILNQDMFLSTSILTFLAKRSLSQKYFYRTDRCDFTFDYEKGFSDWEGFDNYAKNQVITKYIRPTSHLLQMTLPVSSQTFENVYTQAKFFEPKINGVIYSNFYNLLKRYFRCIDKVSNLEQDEDFSYKCFFLHTNASGDFFLAPKKAFFDVNGFVETSEFYMHLDSYICVQLFAAGYKQAILSFPHTTFHSDHSRESREGRPESKTYHEHAKIFTKICLGKIPYKMNPDSWGLKGVNLLGRDVAAGAPRG